MADPARGDVAGWLVRGAKGWLDLLDAMAKAGEPLPPRWLDELEGHATRLARILETQRRLSGR